VIARLSGILTDMGLARKAHYKARLLAIQLHVSLRTLERLFKAALGVSPQAWLKKQRQVEQRRLAQRGFLAKEIAAEVGYRHTSSFCRQFKREHGLSSRVLRTQHGAKC
jgi:AraC-like DNA-binding protein